MLHFTLRLDLTFLLSDKGDEVVSAPMLNW